VRHLRPYSCDYRNGQAASVGVRFTTVARKHFDRKRISANTSPYPNPNSNSNPKA